MFDVCIVAMSVQTQEDTLGHEEQTMRFTTTLIINYYFSNCQCKIAISVI